MKIRQENHCCSINKVWQCKISISLWSWGSSWKEFRARKNKHIALLSPTLDALPSLPYCWAKVFAGTGTHQKCQRLPRSASELLIKEHVGVSSVSPPLYTQNGCWWWNKSCCNRSTRSQTWINCVPLALPCGQWSQPHGQPAESSCHISFGG